MNMTLMLSLMEDSRNGQVPCLNIQFKVLRKVGKEGEWELIPDYVGSTTKAVYLFTYSEGESSIGKDEEGEKLAMPNNKLIDISKVGTCLAQVQRKVIATGTNKIDASKIPTADKWDNGTAESVKYITIGMKNCYGDNPILQAKIEMRPAQYAPLLESLTQVGDKTTSPGGQDMVYLKGSFDTEMINKDLCFVQNYQLKNTETQSEDNIATYVPVKMTDDDFKTQEFFEISFTKDLNNVTANRASLNDANFAADNVWFNSMVSIKVRFGANRNAQSINFYSLNQFGVVEDKESNDGIVEYRTYGNPNNPVSASYSLTVSKEDAKEEQE